jgi:hypothetical protein
MREMIKKIISKIIASIRRNLTAVGSGTGCSDGFILGTSVGA